MKHRILFVEDKRETVETLTPALEYWGYKVVSVTNGQEAKRELSQTEFSAVITDLKILEDNSGKSQADIDFGLDLVKYIKENHRNLQVIIFTLHFKPLKKVLGDLGATLIVEKGYLSANEELKELLEEVTGKSKNVPTNRHNSREIIVPDFILPKDLLGYKEDIKERLARFPYTKNVFLMMKFRSTNARLSNFIIRILAESDLKGIRADDAEWNITKSINNPIAVLHCCKYGIALFDEPEENQPINPNVVQELGIMKNQGKECLILVNQKTIPYLPFDIKHLIYQPYDRQLDVEDVIREWLKHL